jgi:ubiquinone biosynthesis monooxygenase Coq7
LQGRNAGRGAGLGYAEGMDRPAPRLDTRSDAVLSALDHGLRTVYGRAHAARPLPLPAAPPGHAAAEPVLTEDERALAGALMRVNRVGEVCAQALYQAQALSAREPALRAQMLRAAREETDHLAWTQQRLDALGARRSWLDPLWYAGAFAIGLAAGRLGDRLSLGFVVETERQVEQHLAGHLQRLPAADLASRAVVEQMQADEARHAAEAENAGGAALPLPLRLAMRAAAKVMTVTAQRI